MLAKIQLLFKADPYSNAESVAKALHISIDEAKGYIGSLILQKKVVLRERTNMDMFEQLFGKSRSNNHGI